jgi:hypothetical protein
MGSMPEHPFRDSEQDCECFSLFFPSRSSIDHIPREVGLQPASARVLPPLPPEFCHTSGSADLAASAATAPTVLGAITLGPAHPLAART